MNYHELCYSEDHKFMWIQFLFTIIHNSPGKENKGERTGCFLKSVQYDIYMFDLEGEFKPKATQRIQSRRTTLTHFFILAYSKIRKAMANVV